MREREGFPYMVEPGQAGVVVGWKNPLLLVLIKMQLHETGETGSSPRGGERRTEARARV